MHFLQPHLNKMCMVFLAKALWETKEVKARRRNYFKKEEDKEVWFKDVTKVVLDSSDSLLKKFPLKLKTEAQEMIVSVGEEIYSWTKHLEKLGLNYLFADVVYFTPFGTIDESQVFHKYWSKNPGLFRDVTVKNNLLDLSCIFAQQEYVFEHRNEIIDNMQKIFTRFLNEKLTAQKLKELKITISQLKGRDDVVFALLCIWINLRFENLYYEFDSNLKVTRTLNLTSKKYEKQVKEVEQDIVLVCVDSALAEPFKYFFNRQREGKESINESIITSCRRNCKEKELTDYEKRTYLEMVLLVMNQILPEQKKALLSDHYIKFLKWSLTFWQFQDLFLKLFNLCSQLGLIDKKDLRPFLVLVAEKDNDDDAIGSPIKRSALRSIFKDLWEKTEEKIKKDANFYRRLVRIYLNCLNFGGLKILINYNRKLEDDEIFELLRLKLRDLLMAQNDKFVLINKFFEEAFDSNDKREEFKQKIKTELMEDFIKEGYLLGIQTLCNWLSSNEKKTEETVTDTINGIDAVTSMIKSDKSHLADDFLKWLYPTRAKITQVKNHFRNADVSRKYIFDKFSVCRPANDDEMRRLCNKFLDFLFDSDKDIKNFKRNFLLKDEFCVVEFALSCDKRIHDKTIGCCPFPINHLTDFCGLTPRKIEELRTKCADKIEELMKFYTLECHCFTSLNVLINWIERSPGKRRRFIKNFMKTPESVILCNKILNLKISLDENTKENILGFYNNWVRSSLSIPDIKKQLTEMNSKKLSKEDKTKLSAMFDKLEKRKKVEFSEIVYFPEQKDVRNNRKEDKNAEFDYKYCFSESDSEVSEGPADVFVRDMFKQFNLGGLIPGMFGRGEDDTDSDSDSD